MSCGCSNPTPPLPSQPANTCGSCRQNTYLRRYPTGCGCGLKKPHCTCDEPETPLCVPCGEQPEPCVPTYRAIRTHIALDIRDAGTCFPLKVCGCGSTSPDLYQLKVRFRRRGQCIWLLEYPAWDISDCGIEFRWDLQLHRLKPGRYEAQFYYGDRPCGLVEMQIGGECPLSVDTFTTLRARDTRYPTASPPGAYPVFDEIVGYTAKLCSVLNRGDTLIPLCQPDIDRLCAISLCKPVQLQITDGYNSELVTFTGCTNGAVIVTRGSPQHKFPTGSTVQFVWSADNARAACSPCP